MADESRALIPIEEKVVPFYDDQVLAVLVDMGDRREIYVPIRPVAEALGLTWSSQYMRIQRDPVLSEMVRSVLITRTGKGDRELVALPADYLNGWLFGVNANRVKPELREKLIRYQRECYRVLAAVFLPATQAQPPELPIQFTPDLVLSFSAFMRDIARWQVLLDRNQAAMDRRLRALEEGRAAPEKRKTLPPNAEE